MKRRDFLKTLTALIAAPAVAVAASEAPPPPIILDPLPMRPTPEEAEELWNELRLQRAYRETHPSIIVNNTLSADDLHLGPGQITRIEPTETPFIAFTKGPLKGRHAWIEDELTPRR